MLWCKQCWAQRTDSDDRLCDDCRNPAERRTDPPAPPSEKVLIDRVLLVRSLDSAQACCDVAESKDAAEEWAWWAGRCQVLRELLDVGRPNENPERLEFVAEEVADRPLPWILVDPPRTGPMQTLPAEMATAETAPAPAPAPDDDETGVSHD